MPLSPKSTGNPVESADTGIMWGAIFGGALAAVGITVILVPIGTAFSLTVFSPWHHADMGPGHTISTMSAIWLVLVQWVSFGIGGYLTGRLRTEWVGAHTHEVFFRDTAHGFLMWALVSIIGMAVLLATASHAAHATGVPIETEVSPTAMLLYSFSLFLGAFIASAAGALGGHDRDNHYATGRFWN